MKIYRSGAFETSNKGLAMIDNVGFVSGLSIMEADYGMHLFTPGFMGNAYDTAFRYSAMSINLSKGIVFFFKISIILFIFFQEKDY